MQMRSFTSPFRHHWTLDPSAVYLNHGSFGATPRAVLEAQSHWQRRMEAQPVLFLDRELEELTEAVRVTLGDLLNCPPEDMALLPNATTAVNTVLRSVPLKPGDEVLFCSQAYNACRNALVEVCRVTGARPVCVQLPFPVACADDLLTPWLEAVTPRTRLALIDHITSPTALILPVERLVPALQARGVDCLIDGAHVPGQLPLDIRALNPAYYTGNCHKWLCSPKGSAFLYVRSDLQSAIRPLVISHGANCQRLDRSRFRLEFDWLGTSDPSACLAISDAIRFLESQMPHSLRWRHNHDLVCMGRNLLLELFQQEAPCPGSLLGSMAAVPLPARLSMPADPSARIDPLATWLWEKHRIEVPIIPFPSSPRGLIRISAQLYNSPDEYSYLTTVLSELL